MGLPAHRLHLSFLSFPPTVGVLFVFLVVDPLHLLDDLLLRKLRLGVGLQLDGEVLEDALDGGLVDTHLTLPQDRGGGTGPSEENELGPCGVVVGGEVDPHQTIVHLVVMQQPVDLANTTRALAHHLNCGVVLVAQQNPFVFAWSGLKSATGKKDR